MPRLRTLIGFGFLTLFGGCFIILWRTPTNGYSYSRQDAPMFGLPQDASDIDFYVTGYMPVSSYSFQTSESNFREWSEGFGDVALVSATGGRIQYAEPTGDTRMVTTSDGIEYRWTEADRGRYTLYDRPFGRAYYFAHTR
jgi:hypothetical protein